MMASWEEHARNFLLEEEEEDDELFFILLPAVMPFLQEEETPEHTSSLTGAKNVKELLQGHENRCKEEFRMEPELFRTSSSCSSCSSCSTCSSRSSSVLGTNPFASFDGLYVSSDNEANNEAQSAPLNQDSVQGASGGKKRKQSHVGSVIEDYLVFKKRQTSKIMEALNEKKRREEEFSVQKCLDEVDKMVGLADEKSYALDIFKTKINRELFMKTKNQNVRFIWLKHKISALSGSNV